MNRFFATVLASAMILAGAGCANAQKKNGQEENASLPKVYYIKEISSENLVKIYERCV